ncbi:transglutaminase domain-containing protein [Halorubrum coriense DSM 10284]|uniref:Transglutaminase domain-containing protein n=1 Tax=Halorubrum coriense DSM 10284 TaxID=1227466 RepID=M0EDY4_9EURY|nr:transglutaminase domain-containing protein [Halorubrum coriense DSM 10284]
MLTAVFSAVPIVLCGGAAEALFGLPFLSFEQFLRLAVVIGVFDGFADQVFKWRFGPFATIVLLFGLGLGGAELYFDLLGVSPSAVFGGAVALALLVLFTDTSQGSSNGADSPNRQRSAVNRSNDDADADETTVSPNLNRDAEAASDPFTKKIDPTAVRTTAVDIASDHTSGGGTFSYSQAAAIHQYLNENITYVPDPSTKNYVAPPEETLETGAGDCDCQAVLVASMLEAIGATTRLVLCESVSGNRHLLAEVHLASNKGETSGVANSLSGYYNNRGGYNSFYYESDDDNRYWYPADTAIGRYIGDVHQLSDNGYIHGPDADGSWSWHSAEYYD